LNTHEQYEELCALAASGQASPDELTDLRSHLEDCPDCRSAAYDFTQVSAQGLSQLAAKHLHCQIPSGMTQRFMARARSEGIEMTRENVPQAQAANRRWFFATIGAVAAVALIAGFLIIGRRKSSPVVFEHRQLPASQTTGPSPGTVSQDSVAGDAGLQQQLAAVRSEMKFMSATIQEQRAEIESERKASDDLNSRLTEAEKGSAVSQSERAQRDVRIAQLETEIRRSPKRTRAIRHLLSKRPSCVNFENKSPTQPQLWENNRNWLRREVMYATSWLRAISTSSTCMTGTETAKASGPSDEFSIRKGSLSSFMRTTCQTRGNWTPKCHSTSGGNAWAPKSRSEV